MYNEIVRLINCERKNKLDRIFWLIAVVQVCIYLTVVYGISKGVFKDDIFAVLIKTLSTLVFLFTLYLIITL